jgi:hypothetical protein
MPMIHAIRTGLVRVKSARRESRTMGLARATDCRLVGMNHSRESYLFRVVIQAVTDELPAIRLDSITGDKPTLHYSGRSISCCSHFH